MNLLHGLIGILLLTLGRRLFWLFVGGVGFIAGLQMAEQYLSPEPLWMIWVVAAVFGLVGTLLALFFQGLAIIMGGFAAGSAIATHLAVLGGHYPSPIFSLLGGFFGAILLYLLFDWALIGLSSLAGATLIVAEISWPPQFEMILYVGLVSVGIVFQTLLWRGQKSRLSKTEE
ncbi:MAG: hypothetical protein ACWGOX_01995 [Desulforhopalus sp.]